MKSILFRLPEDIKDEVLVELEWFGMPGQQFLEHLIRQRLQATESSRDLNTRGETRADVRERLQLKKKVYRTVKLRKKGERAQVPQAR